MKKLVVCLLLTIVGFAQAAPTNQEYSVVFCGQEHNIRSPFLKSAIFYYLDTKKRSPDPEDVVISRAELDYINDLSAGDFSFIIEPGCPGGGEAVKFIFTVPNKTATYYGRIEIWTEEPPVIEIGPPAISRQKGSLDLLDIGDFDIFQITDQMIDDCVLPSSPSDWTPVVSCTIRTNYKTLGVISIPQEIEITISRSKIEAIRILINGKIIIQK